MSVPRVLMLDHGARWSLGDGTARAAALAVALVAAAGLRVTFETGESRQRDVALAWAERHDPSVRAIAAQPRRRWPDRGTRDIGQGLVVAGPARGMFDLDGFAADLEDRGTLWVALASAVRAPGSRPRAALTLSSREADRMRGLGLPALALLSAKTSPPTREVTSVVVSAGRDVMEALPQALAQLRRSLGPRVTVTVLASDAMNFGRTRFAPPHSALRSRLIQEAGLLVAIGDSSGTALDVFEAALCKTPVSRWSMPLHSVEYAADCVDGGQDWLADVATQAGLIARPGPHDRQTRTASGGALSALGQQLFDTNISADTTKWGDR